MCAVGGVGSLCSALLCEPHNTCELEMSAVSHPHELTAAASACAGYVLLCGLPAPTPTCVSCSPQPIGGAIRALVLAPTRELTAQIKAEAVKLLSPHGHSLGVQVRGRGRVESGFSICLGSGFRDLFCGWFQASSGWGAASRAEVVQPL